jgi:3-hydroxyacyl-CoA dehydrogenase/enoyl-CoA hydratase/3-hydroxybutyryl-CoA epimerase
MGGGIAALVAQKGLRVRMKDVKPEALQAGLRKVEELYSSLIRKRRMTRREATGYLAAISTTTDYSGFEPSQIVIEAVVEKLDIKKQVLREVEERVPESTVLATNTSALSVSEIQSALRHPARLVGLHFFNPVNKMPLVEVVRGSETSDQAVEAAETLARDLGKVPVRMEDGPGFLVNRLLAPYRTRRCASSRRGFLRSRWMRPRGSSDAHGALQAPRRGRPRRRREGRPRSEAFGDARGHSRRDRGSVSSSGRRKKGFYVHSKKRFRGKR